MTKTINECTQKKEMNPLKENTYPHNLILAMYNDAQDIKRIDATAVDGLLRVIDTFSEKERTLLDARFNQKQSYKACGELVGENQSNAAQIISKTIHKLRRYGYNGYFDIDPATGNAYKPEDIKPYIGDLQLKTATENSLVYAGLNLIEQVRHMTEEQLKSIRNFGEIQYQDFIKKVALYEKKNNLTPYPAEPYPDNLIRAIYKDERQDDTHVRSTNVAGLERVITVAVTDQERLCLNLKYKDGLTMAEISKRVGQSPTRISQIVQKALNKLAQPNRKQYYEPGAAPMPAPVAMRNSKDRKELRLENYPFNLIRAIFNDKADDNRNINSTYLKGLYEQIKTLTADQQKLLHLRFEKQQTYTECSEELGMSLAQTRTQTARALAKLRVSHRKAKHRAVSESTYNKLKEENDRLVQENREMKEALANMDDLGINPLMMAKMTRIVKPELLATPFSELGLSPRIINALFGAGIRTVGDILTLSEDDFENIRNFGVKCRHELNLRIREHILLPANFRESVQKKPTGQSETIKS